MADAPSPGELSRRIDHVMAMQAQLVTRAEFAAEQRLVERRFVEVEGDVAEVRRNLLSEVTGLRTAMEAGFARLEAADEKREDKRGTNVRQIVYAGILPTISMLIILAFQIWSELRGS